MAPEDPDRYRAVIRAHMRDTMGYLFAKTGRCIDLQSWELDALKPKSSTQKTGRTIVALDSKTMATLDVRGSWVLGVLLCPGDDTQEVATWAARKKLPSTDRIRFYGIGKIDVAAAFAAWYEAGFGDPDFMAIEGKPERLNHFFGQCLNDQTAQDFEL